MSDKSKFVITQFRLPRADYDRCVALSRQSRVPLASIYRIAVAEGLLPLELKFGISQARSPEKKDAARSGTAVGGPSYEDLDKAMLVVQKFFESILSKKKAS